MYAPRRPGPMKRRRFSLRRRRQFRRRGVYGATSKSGSTSAFGFRSRRLRPRQWRSILWRDTVASTHFRSNNAQNTVVTTAQDAAHSQVFVFSSIRIGANQFFTTAGGMILPDPPAATAFIGNITVRGGIIGLRVGNMNSVASSQNVRIFLIKTSRNFSAASIPSSMPLGWDPSVVADFQMNIGRVVLMREALLENNSVMDVKFRLRPFKIDRDEYDLDRNSFVWVMLLNDVEGAASAVTCCPYFNLSFAADAIGTA